MMVTFTLPGCPPNLLNRFTNRFEAAAKRRQWKSDSNWAARSARVRANWSVPTKSTQRRVVIALYHPQKFDKDGRYGAAKPILDGLKGQLIFDDADQFLPYYEVFDIRCPRDEAKVEVYCLKHDPCGSVPGWEALLARMQALQMGAAS